jgi:putative protease
MVTKKAKSKSKKAVKKSVKKPVKRPKAKVGSPKAKKAVAKKSAAKKPKLKLPAGLEKNLEKIGVVTHYFPHVNAAAVKMLKGGLKVGDEVYVKGHTTDFREPVASIQFDRKPIPEAVKGQEIGLLVKSRARQGDTVYKII